MRRVFRVPLSVAAVATTWEVIGRLQLVASGAFPSLSSIARGLWRDRADYPHHLGATVQAAAIGFIVGNVIAVLCALVFARSAVIERLFRGVGITLFAVPLIAVVPVLLIAFSGETARIVLAAMAVYYPTLVAAVAGLRMVDGSLVDVVRAAGGDDGRVFILVRLRSALPLTMGGLRVAAPAAMLGALLAEFGGGARWGLGSYLLASLARADPARLWGIGLVATAVAALGYAAFAMLGRRVAQGVVGAMPATVAPLRSPNEPRLQRLAWAMASLLVVLGLWTLVLRLLDLSPVVARSPEGVVRYLLSGPRGAAARQRLLHALAETLPISFVGLACGLLAAFMLAVLLSLQPGISQAVLPFALVSQTMPLPALTPLLVLVFGRSTLVMVMVTISVTFFPSLVIVLHGLADAPAGPLSVVEAYGGRKLSTMRYVAVPHSVPYLFTAARLAAPRALLGVMIAEYLATGTGLGNLLNDSRGRLEYGMIWTVSAVAVIVAVMMTVLVGALERVVWRIAGR
jgi:sulfonate transport system permease protein